MLPKEYHAKSYLWHYIVGRGFTPAVIYNGLYVDKRDGLDRPLQDHFEFTSNLTGGVLMTVGHSASRYYSYIMC